MAVTTSERRIVNMREVLNPLVEQHGETRERLVRIEDKVDVLVDHVADAKGNLADVKGDVAEIKKLLSPS